MNNVIHIHSYCRSIADAYKHRYLDLMTLIPKLNSEDKHTFATLCQKRAMEVRAKMIAYSKKARRFRDRGELLVTQTYDVNIRY